MTPLALIAHQMSADVVTGTAKEGEASVVYVNGNTQFFALLPNAM
jgi:hypothetical protein